MRSIHVAYLCCIVNIIIKISDHSFQPWRCDPATWLSRTSYAGERRCQFGGRQAFARGSFVHQRARIPVIPDIAGLASTAIHSVDSARTVFHRSRGIFELRTIHPMSPSDAAWQRLISTLHASGRKTALAITGGGSGAVSELLRVPGGSRLLIEAQIPYDALALETFLGFAPAQASSADTAIAMARSARARAARLVPADTDLVGLGATAALVSDRPRRGEHRFHIAFANSAGIAHCTCVMAKGRRNRAAEEDVVSRAIVLWLARACG